MNDDTGFLTDFVKIELHQEDGWPEESELEARWQKLQSEMKTIGIDGALFVQDADLIYVCGTTQAEALFLPVLGPPLVFGRPPLDRLINEVPWALERGAGPEPWLRNGMLEEQLIKHSGGEISALGLELDVLPVNTYKKYAERALPNLKLVDVSPVIRKVRSIKSEFEIEQMRTAAEIIDEAYKLIPETLARGVTEAELEGQIIAAARAMGHPGLIRMRGLNQNILWGHVLSGENGLISAKVDSPTGGIGIGPGFGQGAGRKIIGENELVSVDICGAWGGYIADQTRLYFTGAMPYTVINTYRALLAFIDELKELIRPGAICGDIYTASLKLAETHGLAEGFMGRGDNRCPFIGHGVGLELNDWPVLAGGMKTILEERMTIALEPRVFHPTVGVIGLEDTYVLRSNGLEPITISDRKIVEVRLS